MTGVVVGIVGSRFKIAGVEPAIALHSVFLAFGASVLAGLFIGTYRACRAARMRPIDAAGFFGGTVTRTAKAKASEIHPGDTVIVQGETASSGTVVASTIRATASNAGGAF